MKKKVLALLLACLMGASALTGCGGSADSASSSSGSAATAASASADGGTIAKIQAAGKLVLGSDPTWPPFEYMGADGTIAGADIDIAQAVADKLGVELEVSNIIFDSLTTSLINGDIDMILSAMTITDERKETIDFSIPYIEATQYIIVPKDAAVTSMEDLAGMSIGSQLGTTGDFLVADEIDQDGGVLHGTGATYQQYKSVADAVLDMKAGNLGAIVCDVLLAENVCAVNDDLKCMQVSYTTAGKEVVVEELGAGLPKGDAEFAELVNGVIQEMLDSGAIAESFTKHSEISANL